MVNRVGSVMKMQRINHYPHEEHILGFGWGLQDYP